MDVTQAEADFEILRLQLRNTELEGTLRAMARLLLIKKIASWNVSDGSTDMDVTATLNGDDGHGGISHAILAAGTVLEAIGLAVGGASVCWESMSGTGIFDEKRATVIVAALMKRVTCDAAARALESGTAERQDGRLSAVPLVDHLGWCRARALARLEANDHFGAFTQMADDVQLDPRCADHPLLEVGELLYVNGSLDTHRQMAAWIMGFS